MKAPLLLLLITLLQLVGQGWCQFNGPRFCAMPSDATNFTCDVVQYANDVFWQAFPALIVSAVVFVVLNILIFVPCCVEINCCCTNYKAETRAYYGHKQIIIPYLFFLLLILGGAGCMIYTNTATNDVITKFSLTLDTNVNELLVVLTNLAADLSNSTYQGEISSVTQNLTESITTLHNLASAVSSSANVLKFSKDIFTYVTLGFIVLVTTLFLGFVLTGNKAAFHLTGCLSWFIVLGICIFIPLCTYYAIVAADLCDEVHAEHGVFDMFFTTANNSFTTFVNDLEGIKQNASSVLCDEVTKACTSVPGAALLCPCNTSNIAGLASKPVTDSNGALLTVAQCAVNCTSKDLKDLSRSIMDTIGLHDYVDTILSGVKEAWSLLSGPQFESAMALVFCVSVTVQICLWLAVGLIGFSFFISESVLMGMERALCCFKAIGELDYHTLEGIERT